MLTYPSLVIDLSTSVTKTCYKMYRKVSIFAFIIVLVFGEVFGKPYLSESEPKCYDLPCPARTVGCKKVIKTSGDKQSLSKTVACLDAQDMVLKEHFGQEANPYGPYTHYESTSYSGTYGGGESDQPININVNNHLGHAAEDFN